MHLYYYYTTIIVILLYLTSQKTINSKNITAVDQAELPRMVSPSDRGPVRLGLEAMLKLFEHFLCFGVLKGPSAVIDPTDRVNRSARYSQHLCFNDCD